MSALEIKKFLLDLKNSKKAKDYQRFFKTGPGQYGEGDLFLGISVPNQRAVTKNFKDLDLKEISILLHSKFHEVRLSGLLILTEQSKKALKNNEMENIKHNACFYLKEKKKINNWDLIDISAPHVLGPAFFLFPRQFKKEKLFALARSKNLWDRRIAVLTTFYFVRQEQFDLPIKLCQSLIKDKEDLIHKACGWLLREIGKKDQKHLLQFLDQQAHKMPRTMLRYSIEKFPEKVRQHYLKK